MTSAGVADPDGVVMTVAGPIAPESLGVTLVHEHLRMDTTPVLAVHGYAVDADGPDHLLRHVVPLLRAAGMTDADVDRLLIGNPRRLLTIARSEATR